MIKPAYRSDIDGLRAVAVLAVIAYHYGAAWLPGGFTGVDVFFVISGFVITRKLASDFEFHQFSFRAFYAARIRRIAPALVTVVAATLCVAWFILFPGEYASLGESAAFAAIGLANVFFYANTGYFDIAADSQPLLHTWSLGVEEQFYLVWPLLIWGVVRVWGIKALPRLLFVLVPVCFAFSVWQTSANSTASFYLPASRAWELALGGLTAFVRPIHKRYVGHLISFAGVGLVATSLLFVRSGQVFPGTGAVPAAVGAALILARSDQRTALSWRPLAAVGLISYSLYLWHWPVLVLYREFSPWLALSGIESAGLCAATIVLSCASYLLIEQPIRRGDIWRSASLGLVGMVIVVLIGTIVSSTNGVPARLPKSARTLAAAVNDSSPFRAACHRTFEFNPPLEESCLFGDPAASPDAVVWGDSHGVELSEAFSPWMAAAGRSLLQLTYSSCPPAQDLESPLQMGCQQFGQSVLAYLIDHPGLRYIYLSTYYDLYSDQAPVLWTGLRNTIEQLSAAGKIITIVAPIPSPGYSVPQAAARRSMLSPDASLTMPRNTHVRHVREVASQIARLEAEFPQLEVLDPAEALCGVECQFVAEGHPLLFDDNHLSRHGAAIVAEYYWANGGQK